MFAQAFRSNRPAILLALLVLVPALFLPGVWNMSVAPASNMPLFEALLLVTVDSPWLPGLLSMLVIGICAVQLSLLANNAELLGQRSHLPTLLFPLLMAVLGKGQVLEPALLGMPLVLAALGRIWSIATRSKVLAPLFDAGILLGLAALVHLPFAFLVVVAWASVSVIRPFQWREYMLPAIGLALPLYLAWVLHSVLHPADWRPMLTVVSGMPEALRGMAGPAWMRWSCSALLVVMLLPALKGYADRYQSGVMRQKNLQASFMAFFFASAVLIAISSFLEGSYPGVLLAAPLAVFASHALRATRRQWLSEFTVIALFAMGLWMQWH